MLHELASDMNKSKRQLFLNFATVNKIPDTIWQAISYRMLSEAGSPLQIHGKTIISLAGLDTAGPRIGLSKARHFQSGNCPDQVPSFGFTGNVSDRSIFDVFLFVED